MANAENKILGSIYEGFTFSGEVGFRVVFSMLHLQNYIICCRLKIWTPIPSHGLEHHVPILCRS